MAGGISTIGPDEPGALERRGPGSFAGALGPTASAEEARALARLAFTELGRAVGGIAGVHRAVADRAFTASGPGAQPARAVHDRISDGVYAAVRGGVGLAGSVVSQVVGSGLLARSEPPARLTSPAAGDAAATGAAPPRLAPTERRAPSETPRGAAALAVLNGLIGDQLEREDSVLRQPLVVRVGGRAVPPAHDALAAAFPTAGPHLVVFLHGLMETEFAWHLGEDEPYAARLARDLGVTPIDIRYNTGRHVSENGRLLADLLDQLVAAWPVEVETIGLVGHSMGGLVARSACHQAAASRATRVERSHGPTATGIRHGVHEGAAWVDRVRHVISLGSPHLGAPLAQGVHWAAAALDSLPETRPFGGFLRRRSAGIRDLRHGSLVDDDWRDQDPDALRARACTEVPLLHGATHCFVTATVAPSARHPLGRLIGDALVLASSASGRGRSRRIGFRDEDGMELGGTHHLALLNHPAVYQQLHDWLSADAVRPAP